MSKAKRIFIVGQSGAGSEDKFNQILTEILQHQITQENIVVTTNENVACDPKAREILKSEFTVYIEVSTSVQAERMSNYRPLLPVDDYSALLDGLQKEDAIIDIALDAGFESHEAFSRAFKQVCGKSPSGFRSNANWRAWENPPYSLHIKGKKIMTITIKDLPSRRLVVMEHHGDPMKLSITLDKLISWAKAQPINLKPKAGEAFGYGYADPRETPPEEWRFDLALTVPKDFKLSNDVIDRELPAGRYAVTTHKGSRDNIGDTIYHLYRD